MNVTRIRSIAPVDLDWWSHRGAGRGGLEPEWILTSESDVLIHVVTHCCLELSAISLGHSWLEVSRHLDLSEAEAGVQADVIRSIINRLETDRPPSAQFGQSYGIVWRIDRSGALPEVDDWYRPSPLTVQLAMPDSGYPLLTIGGRRLHEPRDERFLNRLIGCLGLGNRVQIDAGEISINHDTPEPIRSARFLKHAVQFQLDSATDWSSLVHRGVAGLSESGLSIQEIALSVTDEDREQLITSAARFLELPFGAQLRSDFWLTRGVISLRQGMVFDDLLKARRPAPLAHWYQDRRIDGMEFPESIGAILCAESTAEGDVFLTVEGLGLDGDVLREEAHSMTGVAFETAPL